MFHPESRLDCAPNGWFRRRGCRAPQVQASGSPRRLARRSQVCVSAWRTFSFRGSSQGSRFASSRPRPELETSISTDTSVGVSFWPVVKI